ncbi:hypothetical protein [Photobacterium sp. 1_MG-2023]|uniref:hypothetical protein n=1 Tax=Photobacterium sp. 1_MG-2023 TaxID=3062646 RepID=UPI0026E242F8|nr:hypothetical protein [Photobacterium sp. 1_MG-2023]MDO6707209.1 hypothetical protein [Photobacterium sp. 1_MG-2023]
MIKIISAIAIILTTMSLWIGVLEDPEFFTYAPFIKARPCPKIIFHSPIGMQDLNDGNLTEEERYEEFMFKQYFGVNGIQENGFGLSLCQLSPPVNE